jgi:hypothetical protein
MAHRHFGKCPACQIVGPLTKHHALPQRFYGKGKHNEHIILLCAPCHQEVERRIPLQPKLPDWRYFAIVALFIKEKSHASPDRSVSARQ